MKSHTFITKNWGLQKAITALLEVLLRVLSKARPYHLSLAFKKHILKYFQINECNLVFTDFVAHTWLGMEP